MKFVFDLDGTICFKGEPVSDKILSSLESLTNSGHQVIFASARPIRDMLPVISKEFHNYTMIGGNGSLILSNGKIIKSVSFSLSDSFSLSEMKKIKQLINEFDATYLIDGDWDYAYTGPQNHSILNNLDPLNSANLVDLDSLKSVVKILILTSNNNELLSKKLSELDVYVNKHRNENVLDISPKGIHKWAALKMLGIDKGDYIAFGNDSNDISMFENALYTVMVGHHEELSSFAKESIESKENLDLKIVEKIEEIANKDISDFYAEKIY